MANVGPVLWYLRDNAPTSTIGWSAVTAWSNGATIAAGVLRRQLATPTVGNERVFVAIVAGTTGGSEPAWTATKGAKTTDNTVTWQECTGQPGVNGNTTDSPTWLQNKNTAVTLGLITYDSVSASLQIVSTAGTTGNGAAPSFSATAGVTTADNTVTWTSLGLASGFGAWAAPFARMQSAVTTNWMTAGNSLFAGDDHAETQASAETVTFPGSVASPNNAYSIDHAGSLTLSGTTLKTGASVTTTGASALSVAGFVYGVGFAFNAGSGAVTSALTMASVGGNWQKWVNCALAKLGTTANTSAISTSSGTKLELVNTTMQFGATGDGFSPSSGTVFIWTNTPSAIVGGTIPAALLGRANTAGSFQILDGVDISAITGTIVANASAGGFSFSLNQCKLAAGVVVGTPASRAGSTIDITNCDSSGTDYIFQRYWYQGTEVPETIIIRTGGASNGVTSYSAKLVTTANSNWPSSFKAQPIAIYNTVTGTNRVVTLYGLYNGTAIPNNDDVWIEAEYFGSASSPQGSFANNTKANNLATGSALTADSASAWDSLVTARGNTTAYSLGATIKVASNPGRVFFCTTAGTSAGSEPVGYASAVDGGSVTDGSAVFRAGWRFVLTVTLSAPQPAMAGPIYVTVNAAKVSSTYWVDPLINLS